MYDLAMASLTLGGFEHYHQIGRCLCPEDLAKLVSAQASPAKPNPALIANWSYPDSVDGVGLGD